MRPNGEYYQRDRNLHPPAFTRSYNTSVARSPRYSLISLQNSVGEITGPVFGHNDIDPIDNDLLNNYASPGENPIGERNYGWLKDVGFGFRFAPTRFSTSKVAHLDFAFPLDGDPSIDSVQILLEAKRSF